MMTNSLQKSIPMFIIQNIIEPYSRTPKNADLCEDIEHYKNSLKSLHSFYCYKILGNISGMIRQLYLENLLLVSRASWSFIEIDLIAYVHHYDKTDDILHRWRHIGGLSMFTYFDIEIDLTHIKNYKETQKTVRKFWGILTPVERDEFLTYRTSLQYL